MDREQILKYMLEKIPSFELEENQHKHILQFDLYVHPFVSGGENTYFITQFCIVLEFIDSYVENYARITIDNIASYPKSKPEQFFQRVTEVYVLYNLLNLDGVDKNSVILEPNSDLNGKNPEYRMIIENRWYAFEVKTPDYKTFENRQQGVQLTTRLTKEDIDLIRRYKAVSFTHDNKVKDFIMSAELKYSEYSKREEFRDDVKILVIVWDDFINEVISALVNPSAGLLTENSFTKNINYGNIDSIMVTRFLTPLKRLFYFGEAGTTRSQDIQNVFLSPTTTSGLSFKLSDRFDPNIFVDFVYPYSLDLVVAENYPTDFIDWGLSVGITGISKCPVNIRTRLLKYIMKITGTKELYSYNYINFILVNINKIWNEELNHTDNLNKIRKCINLAVHASTLPIEKLEIDIEAYIKGSLRYQQKVEGDYQKKKGTSEICSCKSDYLFKDCCEKKLQHYKYTSFYNR